MTRCPWVPLGDKLYEEYHDNVWGVPEHDDQKLFGKLILDGAQAGLSWRTILGKTDAYHRVFDNFEIRKVANYDEKKLGALMNNPGIVRNRLKVESAVKNARAVLAIQNEFGSFDKYLWGFVGGKTIVNRPAKLSDIATESDVSRAISKDMKSRGMNFVGPTIIYAYMQAIGMVDDHTTDCWRKKRVK